MPLLFDPIAGNLRLQLQLCTRPKSDEPWAPIGWYVGSEQLAKEFPSQACGSHCVLLKLQGRSM